MQLRLDHKIMFTTLCLVFSVLLGETGFAETTKAQKQAAEIQAFTEKFLKSDVTTLTNEPLTWTSGGTLTLKPQAPLAVLGQNTMICFAQGEPFNQQNNLFKLQKAMYEANTILHGDITTSDFKPETAKVLTGSYQDSEGQTFEIRDNTIVSPVVLDKDNHLIHISICVIIEPESGNSVSRIDLKFDRVLTAQRVYWTSSNLTELSRAIVERFLFNKDKKIYLEEAPRQYKANQEVVYEPKAPLEVIGSENSLCFVMKRDKESYNTEELIEASDVDGPLFQGSAVDIHGVRHHFGSHLGQSWTLLEYKTGETSLCASIHAGKISCCNGVVSREERENTGYEIIPPIKNITFTPHVDINALALYWESSYQDDAMMQSSQEKANLAQSKPFQPTDLYLKLQRAFPGTKEETGAKEMETHSVSLTFPIDPGKSLTFPINLSMPFISESFEGVDLFLSKNDFYFLPHQNPQEHHSVRIPANQVYACSARCSGSNFPWEAQLFLKSPEIMVSVDDGIELVAWCHNNKRPILFYDDREDWLFKHTALPDFGSEQEYFESYEAYKAGLNKVCAGY